jgi:RimJ/RimL family protein N-acetyltransferase
MIETARLRLVPAAYDDDGNASKWDILDPAHGETIGTIGFFGNDADRLVIGYEVANAYRGQGTATEALRAVLAITQQTVVAETDADHIASRRVMEKAGMHLDHVDGSRVIYSSSLTS